MTTTATTTTAATESPERLHVRRQLEQIEAVRQEIRELRSAVDGVNADAEAAAADHQEQIGPLQAKLDNAKTKPAERTEARRQIAQASCELQRRIDDLDGQRKQLQKQIGELEKQTAGSQALRNELMRLAPVEQRNRQWVLNRSIELAKKRQLEAADKMRTYGDEMARAIERKEKQTAETYKSRLARWRAEYDEAHKQLAAASGELNQLEAAMTA